MVILLGALMPYGVWGQSLPKALRLTPPRTAPTSLDYYIVAVEDLRSARSRSVGSVIHEGKPHNLLVENALEKTLFDYFQAAAPERSHQQWPIYVRLEDYNIQEKRIAPNKVNGEAKIKVSYYWYRSIQPVALTSFETKVVFSRPESQQLHPEVMPKLLDQTVAHLQKWIDLNRGKNPALTRTIALRFKNITEKESSDTLYYQHNRPLVWTDFKGNSQRPLSRYAAAVFTSFSYEGHAHAAGDTLVLEIGLKVFMVKPNSWARQESKTASTLRHEQIHFDITKLAAENFKKRLMKAELTIEDYDSEIQYQFIEAFRQMNNDQERYDAATAHGTISGQQADWERKIHKAINDSVLSKP
ncbi:DUF922 domain-containing protein [Dyadobacter jejuensis]|nr:DUF922 domain-containing protein [Dyadobacter jejuensis]